MRCAASCRESRAANTVFKYMGSVPKRPRAVRRERDSRIRAWREGRRRIESAKRWLLSLWASLRVVAARALLATGLVKWIP